RPLAADPEFAASPGAGGANLGPLHRGSTLRPPCRDANPPTARKRRVGARLRPLAGRADRSKRGFHRTTQSAGRRHSPREGRTSCSHRLLLSPDHRDALERRSVLSFARAVAHEPFTPTRG